jgi:hypothetical protein
MGQESAPAVTMRGDTLKGFRKEFSEKTQNHAVSTKLHRATKRANA